MRFLKTKIKMAKQAYDKKLTKESLFDGGHDKEYLTHTIKSEEEKEQDHSIKTKEKKASRKSKRQTRIRKAIPKQTGNNCNLRPTKNVVINFGKAIASFATSRLALPYLDSLFHKELITLEDFNDFIGDAKNKIGGIESFRSLLLILKDDSSKIIACKKVFAMIAEIFIKYFSINWIIHGRVTHKLTYLKYRFKILRRIQNPEMFTYISEGRKNK